MHFSNAIAPFLAACSAGLAGAETIVIEAGDLYFKPSSVKASAGDILEFHFLPNNHSVVKGDLSSPCHPAPTGGFYSGFLPADGGQNPRVFRVTVNDTDPFVFYCSQNASQHNHCRGGMHGFVNQPDPGAVQAYTAAAGDSDVNISPAGGPFGGTLVDRGSSSSKTAATATAAATSKATARPATASSAGGSSSAAPQSTGSTSAKTGSSGSLHGGRGVKAGGLFVIVAVLVMV